MQFLGTIGDYILLGLKLLIPVLFILRIGRVKVAVDRMALITALNITLLICSLCYILSLLIIIPESSVSTTDQQRYALLNRATGPYWYGFWIPVSINILIPQLGWFKKIRNSIGITYAWFWLSGLFSLLVYYVTVSSILYRDYIPSDYGWFSSLIVGLPSFSSILSSLATTLIIVAATYLLLKKKQQPSNLYNPTCNTILKQTPGK